jgi:hypothetical protein
LKPRDLAPADFVCTICSQLLPPEGGPDLLLKLKAACFSLPAYFIQATFGGTQANENALKSVV